MSGTESREREAVKAAYPGEKWQKTVASWPDNKVIAVYFRLKKTGKIK